MNKEFILKEIIKCKNPKDHSNKLCWCGCHNAHNPKRNKNHHSTKSRLDVRIERKFKDILKNIKDLEPEYSKVVDDNFWNLI